MTDNTEPNPTPGNPEQNHPAQEAHGGSMAPGLVDDTGAPVSSGEPAAGEPPSEELAPGASPSEGGEQ